MKTSLLFILFLFSNICYSQNFVRNFSFEDIYSCPNGSGYIDSCIGWTSLRSTPDLFNSCSSINVGVPDNFNGWQPAYQGNGYVDVITYATYQNEREFVATEMISPLTIGKKYFVSCFICRGNQFIHNGASNKMGFRFFTQPFFSNINPCPIDNFCHIYSTTIVTDSINWTKIEGSFIADSSYQYLSIGNYFDDQHTDTIDIYDPTTFANAAQYYIDYICVSEDSLANCEQLISSTPNLQRFYGGENITEFAIMTIQELVSIKFVSRVNEFAKFFIYDIDGKKIFQKELEIINGENEFNFQIESLHAGSYSFQLSGKNIRGRKVFVKVK